jgi:hypothetical protein
MEIIVFACTIVATFLAALTYQQTVRGKAKEKRKYLLNEYYFIKRLNDDLIVQLNDYVIKNQCAHTIFIDNQTFLDAIETMNNLEKMLAVPEIEIALNKNVKYLSGTEISTDNLIKDIEYWQGTLFTIQGALNKLNK